MKIHIKRMDLFAVLTLTNDAGRTFVTTLRRGILKTDPEVVEMVRRFKRGKKVMITNTVKKQGVGTGHNEQGVLV